MSEFDFNITALGWIVGGYLLGSISSGLLFSKIYNLPDPRTIGSGNIGATNVARSGKKSAALLTLLGDVIKGWLAVWGAMQFNLASWVVAGVGLAVFMGHLFPIFLRFKGGKGVATMWGVMLAFSSYLALATMLIWLMVFASSRISSLSALTAAVLSPCIAWLCMSDTPFQIAVVVVMSAFLIVRHQGNIEKLLTGKESRFKK